MRFDQVFLFSKISALAFDNRQIDIDRRQIDRQIQRKKDGQIMLNIQIDILCFMVGIMDYSQLRKLKYTKLKFSFFIEDKTSIKQYQNIRLYIYRSVVRGLHYTIICWNRKEVIIVLTFI